MMSIRDYFGPGTVEFTEQESIELYNKLYDNIWGLDSIRNIYPEEIDIKALELKNKEIDLTCPICYVELNIDQSIDPPLKCCGKRIHYSCIGKCDSTLPGICPLCKQNLLLDGLVSKVKYDRLNHTVEDGIKNLKSIQEYYVQLESDLKAEIRNLQTQIESLKYGGNVGNSDTRCRLCHNFLSNVEMTNHITMCKKCTDFSNSNLPPMNYTERLHYMNNIVNGSSRNSSQSFRVNPDVYGRQPYFSN